MINTQGGSLYFVIYVFVFVFCNIQNNTLTAVTAVTSRAPLQLPTAVTAVTYRPRSVPVIDAPHCALCLPPELYHSVDELGLSNATGCDSVPRNITGDDLTDTDGLSKSTACDSGATSTPSSRGWRNWRVELISWLLSFTTYASRR